MVLKELGVKGTDAVFYQSTKRDRVVFVDEVPSGLVCPVCRDVFIAPKIATCGHPVCEECVRKVVKQTGKCFSCSAFVDHNDYLPDDLSEVKLGDLKVLCRHALGLRDAQQEDEEEVDLDEDEAAAAARIKRREGRSAVEVFVRFEDFDDTACSLALPLRDLDRHGETCEFRPLMCDLCDMEEEEKDDDDDDEIGKENGDPPSSMSMSKLGVRGDVGGICGFNCMLRDMPHHRTTCENRLVNCTFANFGCRWRGSFRRLSAHGSQCRVRPRLCPNGCGAQVSVGPMMKRHLDMCPMGEVACDAPDAEADLAICRPVEDAEEGDITGALVTVGEHPDLAKKCTAVVRRVDLKRHRMEHCEFARAAKCRRCHKLVSARSLQSHELTRCTAAEELCPEGCGMVLSRTAVKRHLEVACVKVREDCAFKPLGCTARVERGEMAAHMHRASGQHLELLRRGLLDARSRGEAFRMEIDAHREDIAHQLERRRNDAMETLTRKEESVREYVETAKEEDAKARKVLAGKVDVLKRAMADQSSTYSGQLLDMFTDISELRNDFERFKTRCEDDMRALRKDVDSNRVKAEALFSEVTEERGDAVGAYKEHVNRALEDEEKQWQIDVDKATRRLRAEFDDYKFVVNEKMREVWDAVRVAGRRFD